MTRRMRRCLKRGRRQRVVVEGRPRERRRWLRKKRKKNRWKHKKLLIRGKVRVVDHMTCT